MSSGVQKQTYISRQGPIYRWNYFGVRIPLRYIQLMTSQGEAMGIHQYLETITNGEAYNHHDIFLLPTLRGCSMDDALFTLKYRGFEVNITLGDLTNVDSLLYWSGISDTTALKQCLQSAVLCLHTTADRELMHITAKGKRSSFSEIETFPFSIFDVLPQNITQEIRNKKWRVKVGSPLESLHHAIKDARKDKDYIDNTLARVLKSIPVSCYSIKTGLCENKMQVDICDLRNIDVLHAQCVRKNAGVQNGCLSNLDLFDAMLASGCLWGTNNEKDVIFLPILERPTDGILPYCSDVQTNVSTEMNEKGLEHILAILKPDTLHCILRKVFPYREDFSSALPELQRRLKGCGSRGRFRPGQCLKINGKQFCMLPRAVAHV